MNAFDRDDDPRPRPPTPPRGEDCCNSGCNRCIFDVYEDALAQYRSDVAAWEARRGDKKDRA